MIEKILSKFREIGNIQFSQFSKPLIAVEDAIKIVQEVAKEYGYGRKLNRCDTCTHYVADKVPPICYLCCKGMEDNYVAKE